jgi:hypothetical protein
MIDLGRPKNKRGRTFSPLLKRRTPETLSAARWLDDDDGASRWSAWRRYLGHAASELRRRTLSVVAVHDAVPRRRLRS